MIWQLLIAGVYSMALIVAGIFMGYRLKTRIISSSTEKPSTSSPKAESLSSRQLEPQSGPLKSMSPLERSLEDSKEIKERIEHLLQ